MNSGSQLGKHATAQPGSLTQLEYLWSDDTGLPADSYSEDAVGARAEEVIVHVYRAYPYLPSPYYTAVFFSKPPVVALALADARFGMPTSRLQRQKKNQITEALRAAVDNERTLEVIGTCSISPIGTTRRTLSG